MKIKRCGKCKKMKSVSEFNKNVSKKDGLSYYCRVCSKKKWDKYYLNHLVKIHTKNRNYYRTHIDEIKVYHQSLRGKFFEYKNGFTAKKLGFSFTFKEFMLFWQQPCFYCKDSIKTIGLDRIDNTKGYFPSNCVSCCDKCNYMKRGMSLHEFYDMIVKIYRNLVNK